MTEIRLICNYAGRLFGAATAFFVALDWIALLLAGPMVGSVIEQWGYGTAFIGEAFLLVMGIVLFYGLDPNQRSG